MRINLIFIQTNNNLMNSTSQNQIIKLYQRTSSIDIASESDEIEAIDCDECTCRWRIDERSATLKLIRMISFFEKIKFLFSKITPLLQQPITTVPEHISLNIHQKIEFSSLKSQRQYVFTLMRCICCHRQVLEHTDLAHNKSDRLKQLHRKINSIMRELSENRIIYQRKVRQR